MASAPSGADFLYIGAGKCKPCHNSAAKGEQFKQWASTPHANAMKSLKGDEAKNPKCLKCHSTAASVPQKLWETITVEEGVSCETCHGPGSAYKTASIMKDLAKSKANGLIEPDEKLCKTCHNPESPTFKGFDYKKASVAIAHPNPNK
ncbi:MAG: multiheme c-type cytochrome [Bacteroidales bacterium]